VTPAIGPTVGVAVTCEMDTSQPNSDMALDLYWEQLEKMDGMDLPIVWVIKTVGPRPDQ
tara:strand:+ start:2059 stop:2235 length:177 start_codon:yes stop_codon:yes gene_type:complete